MDDRLNPNLEQPDDGRANPLQGIALCCPASPARIAVMATLAQRNQQEAPLMNWIASRLDGQPLWLRAAALTFIALGLIALSLLLPFLRGTSHAPAAFADEGGFVVVCPLPVASPPASGPTQIDAQTQRVVSDWEQRTNAKRRASGQRPLRIASEVILDEDGHPAAQFSLPGGKSAEAAELAEQVRSLPGQAAPKVIAVAPGNGDALTEVKPLDDPANPYRDQYTDLDRWIYEHAWSLEELARFRIRCMEAQSNHSTHAAPLTAQADNRFMAALVTIDGWMQPIELAAVGSPLESALLARSTLKERDIIEQQDAADEERAAVNSQSNASAQKTTWIFADPGDDQLYKRYLATTDHSSSADLQQRVLALTPKIPEWLAAKTPFFAVLVPNGEVVSYGALGEPYVADTQHPLKLSGWYRYSQDGTILDQNNGWPFTYANWTRFYWPTNTGAGLTGSLPDLSLVSRHDGSYWVRLSQGSPDSAKPGEGKSRVAIEAFTYSGKRLDIDAPVPPELLTRRFFLGTGLKALYAEQQRTGVWFGHNAAAP